MIFKYFILICFCLLFNQIYGEEEICTINGKKILNKVSDKFLSISIDPVVLLTGVNLSDASLQLAKHISPAFIRLAGPSTSYVEYIDDESKFDIENSTNVVITPSMWFGMNEWLVIANLTPVFGINDNETTNGVWNPKSTLPLLELSDKFNVTCYWQLGYDCKNKTDGQYKEDLRVLHNVLEAFPERREHWKIIASDFSRCHSQEHLEKARNNLNAISTLVEGVMWEPEDSSKNKNLFSNLMYPSTGIKFWTTVPRDTKPITFFSALQWCKQIGDAAKLGYKVVLREPRLHEMFSVTPVFWLSVLYKKLMGKVVLETRKPFSSSNTYVYAHCSKNQNSFLRRGAMTVMVINNETKTYSSIVRWGTFAKANEIQSYIITSPSEQSTAVFLNGIELDEQLLNDGKIHFPPKLRRSFGIKPITLEVPPKSIGFFVLPSARVSACISGEDDIRDLIAEMGDDQELSLPSESSSNVRTLRSRGSFDSLRELQRLLEDELESDETFYESNKNMPDYNILKSRMIRPNEDKYSLKNQFDDARNLLIERAKIMGKIKKPKSASFDSKLDNILEEINKLKEEMADDPFDTPLKKDYELSSSEIEKMMKRKVRMKAARKNVIFTSRELDELITRANKKHTNKYKRGINNSKWEDFKSKVENKKQELLSKTPYNKVISQLGSNRNSLLQRMHSDDFNSRFEDWKSKFENQREDLLEKLSDKYPNFAYPRRKRDLDYQSKWMELKEKMEEKRQDLLGGFNINDIMAKIEEQRNMINAKIELDALQAKMEEAKDKILGAINIDDLKSKAEDLHAQLIKNVDIGAFQSKLDDIKDNLLKNTHLDDLKDNFSHLLGKWNKDNIFGTKYQRIRRSVHPEGRYPKKWKTSLAKRNNFHDTNKQKGTHVKRDINMKMLNLKTQPQPSIPKLASNQFLPKTFYNLNPRTSEEFMSSSDEFGFHLNKLDTFSTTTKKPMTVLDMFHLPKPKPLQFGILPTAPKVKLPTAPRLPTSPVLPTAPKLNKGHPCEKEIFGNGLAMVSGDDLFGLSTERKLDDCINFYNEKHLGNDDFIKHFSDYMKDPRAAQNIDDGMNLSLDDDDIGRLFNPFGRKRRDVDVTKDDIGKYKQMLQDAIKELQRVIKEDRQKIIKDKLRIQKERRKNLEEELKGKSKLIQEQNLKANMQKKDTIVTAENPISDVPKQNMQGTIEKPDTIVSVDPIAKLDGIKIKELKKLADLKEKLKSTINNINTTAADSVIKSRISLDGNDQIPRAIDILGQIEDKRKELQIRADMREVELLKKRLARRQKMLDQLMGREENDLDTTNKSKNNNKTKSQSTTEKTDDVTEINHELMAANDNNNEITTQNVKQTLDSPEVKTKTDSDKTDATEKNKVLSIFDLKHHDNKINLRKDTLGQMFKGNSPSPVDIENQIPKTIKENITLPEVDTPETVVSNLDEISRISNSSIKLEPSERFINKKNMTNGGDEKLGISHSMKHENLERTEANSTFNNVDSDSQIDSPNLDKHDIVTLAEPVENTEQTTEKVINSEIVTTTISSIYNDSLVKPNNGTKKMNDAQIDSPNLEKLDVVTLTEPVENKEQTTEKVINSEIVTTTIPSIYNDTLVKHNNSTKKVNDGQISKERGVENTEHILTMTLPGGNENPGLTTETTAEPYINITDPITETHNIVKGNEKKHTENERTLTTTLPEDIENVTTSTNTSTSAMEEMNTKLSLTEPLETTTPLNQVNNINVNETIYNNTTENNKKDVEIKMINNGKFTEDKITVNSPNNLRKPSVVQLKSENPLSEKLIEDMKRVEKKLQKKLNEKLQGKIDNNVDTKELKKAEERLATNLKNQLSTSKKSRRSVVLYGKPFGDYKARVDSYRKWKPSDILKLNSRNNFRPDSTNFIYNNYDTYNRQNKLHKSKRNVDIDVKSTENEVDGVLNEIEKDYSYSKPLFMNKFKKQTENEKFDKLGDSYDGEVYRKESATEYPVLTIDDNKHQKLISYNDKSLYGNKPIKKKNVSHTKEHIQKILPKGEEKAFTQFFSNLTGLLQSIGKKMENSFKSIFM